MPNYNLEGPKWTAPVVTWSFAAAGNTAFTNAIGAAYQDTIRAAAAQWQGIANVSLVEVAPGSSSANITVGWGSFSGDQVGETKYSYQVGASPSFLSGMMIHIEDPSLLPIAATPGATFQGTSTTLLEIAIHEFGHALGLGLSDDPNAVMFLHVGPNNPTPNASDIAGLQALYGAAPAVSVADTANPAATSTQAPAAPGTIALGAGQVGVYRFFDSIHGTEFLTGSVSEATNTINTVPSLRYEGLAMAAIAPGASDPNAVPIYRFFDTSNGTHFFTASQSEEQTIAATRPDLLLEQSSFSEHTTQQAGDTAVFRFFNTRDGSHFFTGSASERASIAATRSDMTYEGIGFYAPAMT